MPSPPPSALYILLGKRRNDVIYRVGRYIGENSQQADVLVELQVNPELFDGPGPEDLSKRYFSWYCARIKQIILVKMIVASNIISGTVYIDPDDGQRRQVGRVERGETLAVHLDSTVAAQQLVVEQNGHLGYAIVAGHQQTGDEIVTAVTPQVEYG